MAAYRLIPRSKIVTFFAVDVTDASHDAPRAGNDNNCPYCGGVLEPGDKASDCSGSKGAMPFPKRSDTKSWEISR